MRKGRRRRREKPPVRMVNIRDAEGNISSISFSELEEHEELIIEDNIGFGLRHPYDYTEREVEEYARQARSEWNALKKQLRENPELVLTLDRTTERYIPYIGDSKIVQFPQ